MSLKEWSKKLMQDCRPVFSIDKIISEDKSTATILVLFDDDTVIKKTVPNNSTLRQEYGYLRKHKLGLRVN